MIDITELAQSLKAAAENAIGAHERLAAYPYGEIIDISQHEGEQIDIDITDLNEFNKEANPVNILALVETLEKAQRYIDELREWNAGLAQESFERQQRISELLEGQVGSALLERENHHVELVGKLTEHITELESEVEKWKQEAEVWEQVAEKQLAMAIELESRTVKLVDCYFGAVQHMSGGSTDYCHGFVDGTQNAIRAITAAGIKVEDE
ncbi:TPA: ead/Ea22-like family protein [Klebsiella quasipneumoniae subsp. similipneumoniae]